MRALRGFDSALMLAIAACTAGTEPTTDPREFRVNPDETSEVSGRVLTSGTTRGAGNRREAESGEGESGWVRIGPVAGEELKRSRPLGGVPVELGIVRFDRSSDTARTGETRHVLVPFVVADVWSGAGAGFLVDPGPAEAPGR